MGFQFQKISASGTSTPAVARTVVQAGQLMQAFPISEEIRTAVSNTLFEVQHQLVRCVQVWEKVRDEVAQAEREVVERGLDIQAGGRAIGIPGVADLGSHAESFLQSAKLAIRDVGSLLGPFFGTQFDHRFDQVLSWAQSQFPEEDQLVRCVARYEPAVKQVVTMRNAVDHPSDKPRGRLIVHNFRLLPSQDAPRLAAPAWCLSGDDPTPIVEDMGAIIEGVLRLSEDILSICLLKNRGDFPLYIYEIPEAERDPSCPIRLRVSIDLPMRDA
jgi:hypothetical protein